MENRNVPIVRGNYLDDGDVAEIAVLKWLSAQLKWLSVNRLRVGSFRQPLVSRFTS
ncbi:MAG: hypothetical protein SPF72_00185 [Parabacteroides sp.]|nr:hypothetical protein [Parabacteroides sp.]